MTSSSGRAAHERRVDVLADKNGVIKILCKGMGFFGIVQLFFCWQLGMV
jgi:hypothetical protein